MTEIAKRLLDQKLAQCSETFQLLKQDQKMATLEGFRKDPNLYHAVCFRFVTVIEALFDAGQIILTDNGLHATGEDSIATLLARINIVSKDLADRFGRMYGFRNRLVHAYGTLDDAKVAEFLQVYLKDVEELLETFKRYEHAEG